MYQAELHYLSYTTTLGPTDTRDEASRLARSWLDAWSATTPAARTYREPPSVRIVSVREICPHCGRSDGLHDAGYSCS